MTIGSPACSGPVPIWCGSAACGPGAQIAPSEAYPRSSSADSTIARSRSAVKTAPSSSSVRSDRGLARRMASTPSRQASSVARCAASIASTSSGRFTRRRSRRSFATTSSTPISRRRSASASGKYGATATRRRPRWSRKLFMIAAQNSVPEMPRPVSSCAPYSFMFTTVVARDSFRARPSSSELTTSTSSSTSSRAMTGSGARNFVV